MDQGCSGASYTATVSIIAIGVILSTVATARANSDGAERCTSNADCVGSELCFVFGAEGYCQPEGCRDSAGCPADRFCSFYDGRTTVDGEAHGSCQANRDGCMADSECDDLELCVALPVL